MADLDGTKTHQNLKTAFAAESAASRRYLWFSQIADIDGHPESAALLRSVADGETGHAHGTLEFLAEVGDPVTGEPIGDTAANLRAAIVGEADESTLMYPEFAATARAEGFIEIADWFESLARAEAGNADRLRDGLAAL